MSVTAVDGEGIGGKLAGDMVYSYSGVPAGNAGQQWFNSGDGYSETSDYAQLSFMQTDKELGLQIIGGMWSEPKGDKEWADVAMHNATLLNVTASNNDNPTQLVIHTDAAIAEADRGKVLIDEIKQNQWYTLGIQFPAIGDTKVKVYVNGELLKADPSRDYTFDMVSPCYGSRHFRLSNRIAGSTTESYTMYLDNIMFKQNDTYDPAPYALTDVSSTEYVIDYETNTIPTSDTETAASLRSKLTVNGDTQLRIYTDATCRNLAADDAILKNGATVLVPTVDQTGREVSWNYYTISNNNVIPPAAIYDGSNAFGIGTQTNMEYTYNEAGVGGKDASDVVYKLTGLPTGSPGYDFFGDGKENGNPSGIEFSFMLASPEASLDLVLGGWTTAACANPDFSNDTFLTISTGGVRTQSGGLAEASQNLLLADIEVGKWYTFGANMPYMNSETQEGSTALEIYINGEKHELQTAKPLFGTRHFRIAPGYANEEVTYYIDNYKFYQNARYDGAKDLPAELTYTGATLDTSKLEQHILSGDLSGYTVGSLKAEIEGAEHIRVYEDHTFATLLEDTDAVASGNVIVLGDSNGEIEYERAVSYYTLLTADEAAVYNTTYKYSYLEDGTVLVRGGGGPELNIPAEINGRAVSQIAPYAYSFSNITSITLPDSVKGIGRLAFGNTAQLGEADLGNGVQSIGREAFANSSVTKALLPDSVVTLGDRIFNGSSKLAESSLPANSTVDYIPEKMYNGPSEMRLTVPANITGMASDGIASWGGDKTKIVIVGEEGSWAQTMAQQNGFTFEAMEKPVEEFENITVTNIGFVDSEGTPLTGTSADYGKSAVFVTADIANSAAEKDVTVIIALYDEANEQLLAYTAKTVTIPAGSKSLTVADGCSIAGVSLAEGQTLRAFVWSGLDSMRPLCDVEALPL